MMGRISHPTPLTPIHPTPITQTPSSHIFSVIPSSDPSHTLFRHHAQYQDTLYMMGRMMNFQKRIAILKEQRIELQEVNKLTLTLTLTLLALIITPYPTSPNHNLS